MTATLEIIKAWFENGVSNSKAYMIVMHDTYDNGDYPVYYDTADAARARKLDPRDHERVMEIYDLNVDMQEQLNQFRAMAL